MGKKKKREELKEFEAYLYGSQNGWLKVVNHMGETVVFRPDFHNEKDKPTEMFLVGKYSTFEEDANAETK
jgi:hypothetical protein